MMSREFEKIKEVDGTEILDINTTATREHVGEIERVIHYIKQMWRCVAKSLSIPGIKFLHKQILIRMCYFVTMMVNAVPNNHIIQIYLYNM